MAKITSRGAQDVVRNHSPDAPNRSTTGRFGRESTQAFLSGEWVTCAVSSWLRQAKYDADHETLWVEFDSGHVQGYHCSPALALKFAEAPSKGGFLHDYGFIDR